MVESEANATNAGLAQDTGKIELIDDNIILNEEFKKNVAIPYFKDIYKDLAAQSDAKSKGINKVSVLNVSLKLKLADLAWIQWANWVVSRLRALGNNLLMKYLFSWLIVQSTAWNHWRTLFRCAGSQLQRLRRSERVRARTFQGLLLRHWDQAEVRIRHVSLSYLLFRQSIEKLASHCNIAHYLRA